MQQSLYSERVRTGSIIEEECSMRQRLVLGARVMVGRDGAHTFNLEGSSWNATCLASTFEQCILEASGKSLKHIFV